jgi:hypothetical protein
MNSNLEEMKEAYSVGKDKQESCESMVLELKQVVREILKSLNKF